MNWGLPRRTPVCVPAGCNLLFENMCSSIECDGVIASVLTFLPLCNSGEADRGGKSQGGSANDQGCLEMNDIRTLPDAPLDCRNGS
jgi:hypothetical protein